MILESADVVGMEKKAIQNILLNTAKACFKETGL